MKVTRFHRTRDLIVVPGHVWGRHGQRIRLRLALDTAAGETLVVPEILDDIGYGARDAVARTMIRSAVDVGEGYLLRVARFACLGHQERNFRVHAHDLPDGWAIDGLIGLNFLRQFNYEVRSLEGRIRVERAA